jgi:hypothetical protein
LPKGLKCEFLGLDKTYPVIVSDELSPEENEALLILLKKLLTPKFGKVRSLTYGSNAVRNPSGKRKVSSEEFDKRVSGPQFSSVQQENCCADFAGLRGDVARAEGTNGWISDRI